MGMRFSIYHFHPYNSSPRQDNSHYYPEMTVTINLKQNDKINPFFRNNPADEQWVQSLVSNPEMTSTYLGATNL